MSNLLVRVWDAVPAVIPCQMDNQSYSAQPMGQAQNPRPMPKHSGGYVWPVYPTYEIFIACASRNSLKQLTHNNAYDAEATVCCKTSRVVFTSNRNGDLDLYTMNIDGTNVRRVTDALGYDGGAFFNSDGTKICWKVSRPKTDKAISDYKSLLSRNLVQPTRLELFVANSDGTDVQEVTSNNAANFCPFSRQMGNN